MAWKTRGRGRAWRHSRNAWAIYKLNCCCLSILPSFDSSITSSPSLLQTGLSRQFNAPHSSGMLLPKFIENTAEQDLRGVHNANGLHLYARSIVADLDDAITAQGRHACALRLLSRGIAYEREFMSDCAGLMCRETNQRQRNRRHPPCRLPHQDSDVEKKHPFCVTRIAHGWRGHSMDNPQWTLSLSSFSILSPA